MDNPLFQPMQDWAVNSAQNLQ